MRVIGYILLVLGLIGCLYWQLRFLVVAYRQSLLWFLGCLLVPFVDFLFLILHFRLARRSFGFSVLALIVTGFGGWLAGVEWPA